MEPNNWSKNFGWENSHIRSKSHTLTRIAPYAARKWWFGQNEEKPRAWTLESKSDFVGSFEWEVSVLHWLEWEEGTSIWAISIHDNASTSSLQGYYFLRNSRSDHNLMSLLSTSPAKVRAFSSLPSISCRVVWIWESKLWMDSFWLTMRDLYSSTFWFS